MHRNKEKDKKEKKHKEHEEEKAGVQKKEFKASELK